MQDPSERPRSLLRREIERLGEDRRYGTSTSGLSSTSSGVFGRGEDDDEIYRRSVGLRASPPSGLPPRPDPDDPDRFRHLYGSSYGTSTRVPRRSESGLEGSSFGTRSDRDRDRDAIPPSSSFPRRARVGAAPSYDPETRRYVSTIGRVSDVGRTTTATTTRVSRSPPDWQSGSSVERRCFHSSRTSFDEEPRLGLRTSSLEQSTRLLSGLLSTRSSLDAFTERRRARLQLAENDARLRYDPGERNLDNAPAGLPRAPVLPTDVNAPPRRAALFDRPRGLRGLVNRGNTCFAAACLQSLAHTPPLTEFLLRESLVDDVSAVAKMTRELVRSIHKSDIATLHRDAVDPVKFLRALDTKPPLDLFTDGDQHDSQEFLRFLLDSLDEDFNSVKVKPRYHEEKDDFSELEIAKARRLWEKYRKITSGVVVDVFAGQLKSAVTCHSCRKVSTSYDPFWDLSLPLRKRKKNESSKNESEETEKTLTRSSSGSLLSRYMGGMSGTLGRSGSLSRSTSTSTLSVTDCLDAFGEDEHMLGADAFNCPRCKKKGEATKNLTVQRPPRVLVLHLKRFQWNDRGRPGRKVDTSVDVPLTLSLSSLLAEGAESTMGGSINSPTYELFSIINHSGSLSGGHYTATTNVGANEWYNFNDERVSSAGDGPPKNSRNAYVLFYALKR